MLQSLSALATGELGASHHNQSCVNGTVYDLLPSVKVVVVLTCVLSMIGACLIVLSYVLMRDIRTKAREILVHLSLMDFMYSTANLAGIAIGFDKYSGGDLSNHTTVIHKVCIAQASFALYGTLSSIYWTISLAAYVYLRVVLSGKNVGRNLMLVFYLICYGLPLIITLWFSLTRKLGYDHYGGSGWCSLLYFNPDTLEKEPLNGFLGNDIFIYLAVFLIPIIFVSIRFHLRQQVRTSRAILTHNALSSVHAMEIKLMLIPIFFILLRVWSLIFGTIETEIGYKLPCGAVWFFLHIQGIGDSGQGFANAILFVVFTPKVRRHFIRLLLCYRCWSHRQGEEISINTAAGSPEGRGKRFYGSITSDEEQRREFSETSQTDDGRDSQSLLLNTGSSK